MKTSYEIRTLIKDLHLRAKVDGEAPKIPGSIGTLEGYAAKFNTQSRDFGGFRETLLPGCFKRSLSIGDDLHDVRALLGHDKNKILGRRSAGTLEVNEDSIGLRVGIHLMDTTEGRDTLTNVRCGNLDAMSFGFKPIAKPEWSGVKGTMVRSLKDVDVYEVSVVSWAQYEDTEVSARDLDIFKTECPVIGTPVSLLRMRHDLDFDLRTFDESKHDRAKDGKWTASAANDASKAADSLSREAGDSKDSQLKAAHAHKTAAHAHKEVAASSKDKKQALRHSSQASRHDMSHTVHSNIAEMSD